MDGLFSCPLLDEYLHSQRLRGRSPGTIKAYREFLTRFLRTVGKDPIDITTGDVRRFLMDEESRGNKIATMASKITTLNSFYTWLLREDYIVRNPMGRIDRPTVPEAPPKFLQYDEIEALREAAAGHLFRETVVEVLYSSGARVSELVALDWDDIDWQAKAAVIRSGKGGKERIVPLSTRAIRRLRRLRESRQDSDPWVFRSQFKQRISKATIQWHLRRLQELAGLTTKITPHKLRHSQATHLLDSGMPLEQIQAILGHVNISTTQVYARTQMRHVEQHYRRMFP